MENLNLNYLDKGLKDKLDLIKKLVNTNPEVFTKLLLEVGSKVMAEGAAIFERELKEALAKLAKDI